MSDWNTKEADLELAQEIVHRHIDEDIFEDEIHFNLQNITYDDDSEIRIEQADWVVELHEAFEKKYGDTMGYEVANKVLAAMITHNQIIH